MLNLTANSEGLEPQAPTTNEAKTNPWKEEIIHDERANVVPQLFEVIVVEDDITTTDFIKKVAQETNHYCRIKSFNSMKDVITHMSFLKTNNLSKPDLAIIDIFLEGEEEGFVIADQFAMHLPETTLVMTSSMDPRLFHEKANHLNVAKPMFIPKPFTVQQISNLFRRLN